MSKVKKRFCKYCGSEIDSKEKICTGCGHSFFSYRKLPISIFLLLFCLVLGGTCIYLYVENQKLQEEVKYNKELIEVFNKRAADYYDQILSMKEEQKEERKLLNIYKNDFAYVTATGNKYHTYDCSYIQSSNTNIYIDTIQTLRQQGYSECNECY